MNLLRCLAAAAIAAASRHSGHRPARHRRIPSCDTVTNRKQRHDVRGPEVGAATVSTKADGEGAHFTRQRARVGPLCVRPHPRHSACGRPGAQSFIPTRPRLALLPYWRRAYGSRSRSLDFSNPEDLVKAALTRSGEAKVRQHKIKSVTGQLTIRIDSYVADGECDTPYYSARFVKNERTGVLVAAMRSGIVGC